MANYTTLRKYQRYVRMLQNWQPTAFRIRFGICHCKQKLIMLSYLLPTHKTIRGDSQDCGYFCTHCRFGNAGGRPLGVRKVEVDKPEDVTTDNIDRIIRGLDK